MAIDIQESRDRIAAWVRQAQVTFPVVLDADGKVTAAYKVTATPTVFVVDRNGAIVGTAHGSKDWTGARGRALLDALVAK